MPRVEIQSFIKEFRVCKARHMLSFLQAYTFYDPFSSALVAVTCLLPKLLAASIQEEGIRLYKGPWKLVSRHGVFFSENKLIETFILVWYFLTS